LQGAVAPLGSIQLSVVKRRSVTMRRVGNCLGKNSTVPGINIKALLVNSRRLTLWRFWASSKLVSADPLRLTCGSTLDGARKQALIEFVLEAEGEQQNRWRRMLCPVVENAMIVSSRTNN